jgi:class 3 adenylate cyclase
VKTLVSPQWRVFYLALLIGLVTGTVVATGAAYYGLHNGMLGLDFWLFLAITSVLVIGLPHYILFKVALRRQLGRFLRLFYTAIEQPVPKLENPFKSRELDDLDALFAELLRQLREYIDRTVVRQVELERLQRYFSPSVVEYLAEQGTGTTEDVRKMHVTVLFCDIRGFTPMSSRLTPAEVVEFLNLYFTAMIDAIYQERGTVLKLIGDAVMAVFGAPASAPDDTERALRAGCAMQAAYDRLEQQWLAQGKQPPIGIGVGINSGEVIVGNIGSPSHLDYTVIGDTVNVASRLTSVAQPGQVVVAAESVKDVEPPPGVVVEPRGEVRVKGKDDPIPVCLAYAPARAPTLASGLREVALE